MGYRSQVVLAFTEKIYQEFNAAYDNAIGESDVNFKNPLTNADYHLKDIHNNYIFIWKSVKWNEYAYPDVDFVITFIKNLNKNDKSNEYHYKRIGEMYEDIEESGVLDTGIYFLRTFDFTGDYVHVDTGKPFEL
jgi:hypothetical protein